MTPTSNERREFAARLRKDVSESECIDYAVFRISHEVLGAERVTSAEAAHVLADLIDPTCTAPLGEHEHGWLTRECSECGYTIKTGNKYCPNCGARVVTDNDAR